MNFLDFVKMAQRYSDLGSSVQAQMADAIGGEPLTEMNPNALRHIRDLVEALKKYEVEDEDSFWLKQNIDDHLGKNETDRTV